MIASYARSKGKWERQPCKPRFHSPQHRAWGSLVKKKCASMSEAACHLLIRFLKESLGDKRCEWCGDPATTVSVFVPVLCKWPPVKVSDCNKASHCLPRPASTCELYKKHCSVGQSLWPTTQNLSWDALVMHGFQRLRAIFLHWIHGPKKAQGGGRLPESKLAKGNLWVWLGRVSERHRVEQTNPVRPI